MIQIKVRASFLVVLLIFFACASLEGQSLRDKHQLGANNDPTESRTDREHYAAGRSLAKEKRYEGAILEFRSAISINSKNALYYDNLGFCLKELRRYDEAIEALNQALSLDGKDSYAYRELGVCYCCKQQFKKAIDLLQQCVSLNPSDAVGHVWLGYTLCQVRRYDAAVTALEEALKLRPNDFGANYWRGFSSFHTGRFEEASRSLGKAVELRSTDFNANFWLGKSLVRARKFSEATPRFEKAHEIRQEDKAARAELFACYLATQQFQKAFRISPLFIGVLASALTFIYLVVLVLLLPFSLRQRALAFPGLRFSFAWLALFFEGQIAFPFLLAVVPSLKLKEYVFLSVMLAGLPVIIVAMTGFARQPWGEPFRWPLRLGSWKSVGVSLLLLSLFFLMNAAVSALYVQLTHKPVPLQNTIPIISRALRANAVVAWLAVPLVVPIVEEILFRGLFYGALQKRWGIKAAIVGSALLFACVHLQLVGFFYLFCFGLILAWARWRAGSLGLPIAIHCLNNALLMLALTFVPPM